MKTVIYARVSTKEQEESGYSLPAQTKLLNEYAERKGLKLTKRFEVSESASGKTSRKVFAEMIEYCAKKNVRNIVVEKTDRITRNLREAVMINDWMNGDPDRYVHLVKENIVLSKDSKSNEKFIWNIKVSVAQYYTDNLSEEVKKGQKEKIAQGWIPTAPPIGYRSIGEKGSRKHVLDEAVAPLVRDVFEQYATGEFSTQKLSDYSYKQGLLSRNKKQLSKSRISDLLRNPYYYGKFYWNDVLYDGNQEPIINEELFDLVQGILTGRTAPNMQKSNHLFRGLMKCIECGGTITWETHKGHTYGHCNHYKGCGQKIWHKENAVEEKLIERFDELIVKSPRLAGWIREALKEHHQDEITKREATTAQLNQQLTLLSTRLDKIYDDKLDGGINQERYDRKFKQYSQEEKEITKTLKRHLESGLKYFELGALIFELSQEAKNLYLSKEDPDDRRTLLNIVFDSIILSDKGVEFHYSPAFELLSQAVRESNAGGLDDLMVDDSVTFEPSYFAFIKRKTGTIMPVCSTWRSGRDLNPRPPP